MKQTLLLILLWVSSGCMAAGLDTLYKEFSEKPRAESFRVGKFVLSMAKAVHKELKGLDAIEMVDLTACDPGVKQQFRRTVQQIDTLAYTHFATRDEEGSTLGVYMLLEDDLVREFLCVVDGDECSFVYMKGKLSSSDLQQLQQWSDRNSH